MEVPKNSLVKIKFKVRSQGVYFGGLDFRSSVFNTSTILPGKDKEVEFTADESFTYTSYWPLSNKLKATGEIIVM